MIFGSNKHKHLLATQMKGQQANSPFFLSSLYLLPKNRARQQQFEGVVNCK